MGQVFVFSLTAADPTLPRRRHRHVDAVNPQRLLLGYLLGGADERHLRPAAVFALPGTRTASTASTPSSPAIDITLGALILVIVIVVATGRDRRRRAWSERTARKGEGKGASGAGSGR